MLTDYTFLFNKPSSRPGSKSVLIFGRILVLKESLEFLQLMSKLAVKT